METFGSSFNSVWSMKIISGLVVLLFLLGSCNSEKSPLEDFRKLEGTWVENGDVTFTETWKWENDSLISGSGIMKEGKKILFSEKLQLVSKNDSIYYVPNVSNQNQGKIVRFALVSKTENKWVFENKKHDFPTTITYTFSGEDSLTAVVEGIENKLPQKYTFRMKKVK